MHSRIAACALVSLLAAGCAEGDLGASCHLLRADNTEVSPRPGHDIVQSGSGECMQFVCASFQGGQPQCSEPCTEEGAECGNGWVCRRAVLSPESLAETRRRTEGTDSDGDGKDDARTLTAALTDSLYCGPPR
jgi:hypothetical protein